MSKPSTRSAPDPVASQGWVERLQRYAAGNQTVVAFCAAEGVSESNFYLWKRRLAARLSAPAPRVPRVVPLRITPSAAACVELTLPSGAVVRFPVDTGAQLVVAILRGWEGQSC
jgi:transposase